LSSNGRSFWLIRERTLQHIEKDKVINAYSRDELLAPRRSHPDAIPKGSGRFLTSGVVTAIRN
jgi:hypothetical protein